jgi:hypothetical protein
MQDLDLPRRYRTIIVPSSSFQLVLDPGAARRAMDRFAAHLEPGGRLVMPFIAIGRPGAPLEGTWVREATRPEDGATVRRTAWARYDPATRLERTSERYELIVGGRVVQTETVESDPATRDYRPDEAAELFTEAGLSVEQVLSGFTLEPYDPARAPAPGVGDGVFTIIGRRD